jgi:hypothetical protein
VSWRLAPADAQPSGMPLRSANSDHFQPRLPRSAGLDVVAQTAALRAERADDVLKGPRERPGPPSGKDHRVALEATVLAGD